VLLTALNRFPCRRKTVQRWRSLMATPPSAWCEPIVAGDPRTGGEVHLNRRCARFGLAGETASVGCFPASPNQGQRAFGGGTDCPMSAPCRSIPQSCLVPDLAVVCLFPEAGGPQGGSGDHIHLWFDRKLNRDRPPFVQSFRSAQRVRRHEQHLPGVRHPEPFQCWNCFCPCEA